MKCSIIIPTFNRCDFLKITLDSLTSLDTNILDHEIIVVDNHSIDATRQVVESFIKSKPSLVIRYCYEPIPGSLSARHRGAFEAEGEILIFVDDDVIVCPEWLDAIVETLEDPKVHLVGGKNLPRFESTPPEWINAFWFKEEGKIWCADLSLLDFGDAVMEIDPVDIWSLNYAIRRSTLFELGGFHPDIVPAPYEHYQGDGETGLAWKVKAKGYKVMYQPKAMIHHIIPDKRVDVSYFMKRMFFYGIFDSFTRVRANKGLKYEWRMQKPIPEIKRMIRGVLAKFSSDPYAELKKTVRAEWLRGYQFHQNAVRKDPAVLEWVLREDYMDYRYGPYMKQELLFRNRLCPRI